MGYSNEERLEAFFNGMRNLRIELFLLKKTIKDKDHNKEAVGVVDGWIEKVDHIAGDQAFKLDFSGGRFLLGKNENDFQSLFTEKLERKPRRFSMGMNSN